MTKEEGNLEVERLKGLLTKVDELNRYGERNREEMFKLFDDEWARNVIDKSDLPYQSYRQNLNYTKNNQLLIYKKIVKRRPKKGAPDEYKEFLNHFKQDIGVGIREAKHKSGIHEF
ncbi:hypothetical protein [Owenweeksia hongkongensis]|uniref:hypothetical protein n=1 Tax=Owenweeksia hongkongensis TaxID=253245 RepID=UPI003A92D9AD